VHTTNEASQVNQSASSQGKIVLSDDVVAIFARSEMKRREREKQMEQARKRQAKNEKFRKTGNQVLLFFVFWVLMGCCFFSEGE